MRDRIQTLPAMVFFAAVIGGCGTEPEEPPFELTEEHAVAMFTALYDVQTRAPVHESEDSVIFRCPTGGDVKVEGTVQVEVGTTVVTTLDYAVTPRGCSVTTTEGDEFELGGQLDDDLVMTITLTPPPPQATASGSIAGELNWAHGEHTGSCTVSLAFENASTSLDEPLESKYEGMLCGFEVTVDLTRYYEVTMPPH